ncbi:30S ribosomal protein S1 [Fimbriimonas ginsengisoli]|uniref:SSU ribosomal protein S1p n=1 Tax=Fimbriimonas ginsengisoli Gsoil 348 TaxID=661478 RepID=A0A068NMM4_FIMGI|nr:S1 RNA-binding domain-containing protein [Fimbriimonas ginsengisoli]AIE84632.1 SSU ribosomal protein S1p [Fimbriimonas ginsengisoli Gsoil 348]
MTIDQNPTPMGEQEALPVDNPGTASDAPETTPVAVDSTNDAPVPAEPTNSVENAVEDAPVTEAASADAAPVAESTPVAEEAPATPAEEPSLPGSEPSEPEHPATIGDPVPAAPEHPAPVHEPSPAPAEPATPGEPAVPTPAPAVPHAAAPAVDAAPRDKAADADLFESYMSGDFNVEGDAPEGGFKRLTKGERIEATIIQVDRDKVFVDLGTKSEGIVPLGELSEENLETAKGHFNVGDKINVIVLRPEGAEGNPIVSKKRAEFEEAWDRIEQAHRDQTTIKAQVVDRVKGGLVVDVGVRGFVPATHVGSGKLRNIEKYVGNPLDLKVIEIDRDRKKVVLSNRQAEEERRQAAKDNIFNDVKPGDTLEGTVRRLTDYGAFVDLGGVDGLLHISEMSWARINHPKEMFKEGQKIKVMVLRLDPSAGKISLGHRQVLPDPWNLIKENYKVGQNLKITIGRIVQSGAFIKLPEGAEAFMPVSEMSYRRIKRPQDVVEENQEVEAQIIDLRPDERRMVLSMRALGGGGELKPGASYQPSGYEEDMRRAGAGRPGGPGDKKKGPGGRGGAKGRGGREEFEDFEDLGGRRGFSTSGGATIGERLGMLKGLLSPDDDEPLEGEEKEATEEGETE